MSQDGKVIGFMSPADVAALMRETELVSVEGTATLDGRPVIQASVKVMNARTGEELPGGLPFAVVLFKDAGEPGYTNIAIGTTVPVAEMGITLPPDFFNRCNRDYRFLRAYAFDRQAIVLQMDLFLRHATREYVKFGFGVWAAGFSQILFDLAGQREGESVGPALEAFAASEDTVLSRYATAVASTPRPAEEMTAPEPVAEAAPPAAEPPAVGEAEPPEEEELPPVPEEGERPPAPLPEGQEQPAPDGEAAPEAAPPDAAEEGAQPEERVLSDEEALPPIEMAEPIDLNLEESWPPPDGRKEPSA